jgi:hypothetical protein
VLSVVATNWVRDGNNVLPIIMLVEEEMREQSNGNESGMW